MKSNNLFSDKQFGFISERSTLLQFLQLLDKLTESIDKGDSSDVINMDYLKAFDTVPQRRLAMVSAQWAHNVVSTWI